MPCLAKTSAISRSRGRLRIRLTVRSIPRSVYGGVVGRRGSSSLTRSAGDAGEVELLQAYGGDADTGGEVVVFAGLELGGRGQPRRRCEGLHHRLREAHVLDRTGDFAVLDKKGP